MSRYTEARNLSHQIEGYLREFNIIGAFEKLRLLQAIIVKWDDAEDFSESKVQEPK